jgi:hypothetical protein
VAMPTPVSAAGESGGAFDSGNAAAAAVVAPAAVTGAVVPATDVSNSFTMWLKPQSSPAAAAPTSGGAGDTRGDGSSTISSFGPMHGRNNAGGVGMGKVHNQQEVNLGGSDSAAVTATFGVMGAASEYSGRGVSGGSGGKLRRQMTQFDGHQRLTNGGHDGLEQQQQQAAVQSQHVEQGSAQLYDEGAHGFAERFWSRSQETRRVLPAPRTSYDTRRYSSDHVLPGRSFTSSIRTT